jgi:chromosome transmission fidelity protein 18
MKEADTTVHSVLNDLFTPLTKKRTMEFGLTEEEESRYVHRLSRDIEGAGRDSAIATGMYCQIASEETFSIDIYVQAVLAITPRFVDMTLIFRDTNKASNG